MPYSFFEIERQKNRTILLLFSFLVLIYFILFFILWWVIKLPLALVTADSLLGHWALKEVLVILSIAFTVGFIHWLISQYKLVDKFLGILNANSLNPHDKYHQVFENTLEEISVASGGVTFESCVIPTAALNAFSRRFSG